MLKREDIIAMAREAGGLPDPMVFIGAYERFAALVAAAEREACAQVVEQGHYAETRAGHAAAIRARGETK